MKHKHLLLLWVILFCLQVKAQDSITAQDVKVNQQIWIDYNFKNRVDSTKILNTEIGFRKITPKVYNKFLAISTLSFPHKTQPEFLKLKNPLIESFELGLGTIFTDNYNADDNLEIRFIQGFKFTVPALIRHFDFKNYVRLEERFQTTFDGSGWTAGYRIRYRISTVLKWKKHLVEFTEGIYFPLSFEMFFNLKKSDSYNDLVRISPGIGYQLKNDWRFELYLIFNESKNTTETSNNSSEFILRIRVYSGQLKNKSKEKQLKQIPKSD
ncbi:DUF2490 domain-containing protein [Bizionia arctica]|uniref:DUF2490 domain-containing protein n=1 Tax=Bizionia arctica TaxID=1495645 RepID=A0A917G9U9_9FLAO|nr:DUF2490 domain-containing protein [Bizionia arctica]GGG32619.1 hypothetical protein GCM10010976_00520 [Bizionia arctica]